MHSFTQSLVILIFFLLTFSTYADELSPRYNVPRGNDCPAPEQVTMTVTVTVTAPASAYSNPANGQYSQLTPVPSDKPISIPEEYKTCFDRNRHSFAYSYHHGGYHFGVVEGGLKTGESNTKVSSTSAYITKSSSSLPASKASSTSYISYYQTTNVSSTAHSNSTSTNSYDGATSNSSYSKTTLTSSVLPTAPYNGTTSNTPHSNTTSTSSVLPTNSTVPSCQPDLQLAGASEYGFNKKSGAFSVKIVSCSKFDVASTTAFANFAPIDGITVTSEGISFPGFTADYVLLSLFALDTYGNAVLKSYQLHFGSIDMPILVLGPDNQPASGVLVYGNATIYPGVSQECTTDASGQCSLTNLPPTTIGLVARTDSNSIAVNGLAATTGQITLKLLPFTQPTGDSTFDVNNGTSGWTKGVLSQSLKIKRDTTLTLSTNGQFSLQSASNSFKVHPFTKTAYIKYKFITSEVPGGFFGTQFNDYYSVTIRSDTGALVTVTNSMNALGLGAFDASGATDWFTLSLKVPADTKSVEYDIGVSNVADSLLDSSIVVDKVGDLQCDQCGDCSSCPSDPMCQSSCINPPLKSCDFYRNCAEGQLGCGPSGYPLAYGEKNCNRFVNNLNYFSTAGQNWIFGTMHCLQTAMAPVLQPCTATCSSFRTAAFNSHPSCYVDNGFCGLQCPDVLAVIMTVNTDLISLESLKQAAQTSGLCLENLIQTLTGCTGDVVFGAAAGTLLGAGLATKIALGVVLSLLKSAAVEIGS